MRVIRHVVISLILATGIWAITAAGVPNMLNYQGRLTDDAGNPLNDTVRLEFGLFTDSLGTTQVWKEVHSSVPVADGLFKVMLGSIKELPDSIFDGSVLWLGTEIDFGPVLSPLTPIVASPYSFHAIHADTADYAISAPGGIDGWSQSGNYVRLADVSDSVGVGVLNPVEKLHVGGNILLGAYGDIRFSPDNTRINCESNDLQVKAQSDLYLEPYDDLYVRRRDGGSSWVHFDNSTQRLGIGMLDPPYTLTVNGDISIASGGESKYHINYYQGGLNIAETGVQDRRIHISDGGNVGIGTAGAQEKLHVYGNAKIKDTIKVGAFEENAINRDNILDEVGLAYNNSSSTYFQDLGGSFSSYLSQEITVPTSGYILAIANASVGIAHGISGSTGINMAISDTPNDLNGSTYMEIYFGITSNTGYYRLLIPCQRLFNVSAGTHTFYLIARSTDENITEIGPRQMSLIFIPTPYGSKNGIVDADMADNFSPEPDMSKLNYDDPRNRVFDQPNIQPASDGGEPALLERIESLTAEVEALKKRMEVYEEH